MENSHFDENNRERFIGAWKLVAYEITLASGDVLKPFGEKPSGLILYQEGGQMSAQLMLSEQAAFGNPDPLQATAEETDKAWRNYIGYWGTYAVNAKDSVVTHHVEGGWFPNWVGQEQVRAFQFRDRELVLAADTPAWHAELIWRRAD